MDNRKGLAPFADNGFHVREIYCKKVSLKVVFFRSEIRLSN